MSTKIGPWSPALKLRLECPKCGNSDDRKFVLLTKALDKPLPHRSHPNQRVIWAGYRCNKCGEELLFDEAGDDGNDAA